MENFTNDSGMCKARISSSSAGVFILGGSQVLVGIVGHADGTWRHTGTVVETNAC